MNYPKGGVRILSLDDGGARCYSSLIILRSVMVAVKEGRRLDIVPEPFEFFDLICGSGFGGVVALMLGRLQMGINECINAFQALGPQMLGRQSSGWLRSDTSAESLEKALKAVIADKVYDGEALLDDGDDGHTCKSVVLAMYNTHMRLPVRLRSYTSRMDPVNKEIKIWEAGRATTARPLVLPPISIGATGVTYVDAGIGFSNPAREALDEAVRIWQFSNISCLVSIGTGIRPPARLENQERYTIRAMNALQSVRVMRTILDMTTDQERTHEELARDARLLGLKYFRFNVQRGLEDIGFEECHKFAEIETQTALYLESFDVRNTMAYCALHLKEGLSGRTKESRISDANNELRDEMQSVSGNPASQMPISNHPLESTHDPQQSRVPFHLRYDRTSNRGSNRVALFDEGTISNCWEQDDAAGSAEEWFYKLETQVHPVIEKRRKRNDKRVKVAILDSGIEETHPKLLESLARHGSIIKERINWTTSGGSSDTTDNVGHGTALCELLLRVAKVELYVGKVFNAREGDENISETISKAIDHAAVGWDVRIIVLSFGFIREDEKIRTAIQRATTGNLIVFAAASNKGSLEGIRRVAFPARMPQVIAMNSSDGFGSKSRFTPSPKPNDDNFSTVGEAVQVAWPTNLVQGGVRMTSGTSIATPIAAGIAALVLEFVSQRGPEGFNTIPNIARLLHYDGMRAILSNMCGNTLVDGYHWIQPWNLFSRFQLLEDNTYEDISRAIAYELENL